MSLQLPDTLARPLNEARRNIEDGHWFLAMNNLLDYFETGASYTSIVLLALFRKNVNSKDSISREVIRVIKRIDEKRPLSLGDWVNDILAPLAVEAAKRFPENAFAQSIEAVAGRNNNNVFLPQQGESGVVQIRNRYKGHGTLLSDTLYEEVVKQLTPRALKLAQTLSLIQGCGVNLEKDLFPLVHHSEEGYEYVFQTLSDEAVAFISTDENAPAVVTEKFNDKFDAWIQSLVPSFDIAKDINWDELVTAMHQTSREYLSDIFDQNKYSREQFVEREQLSRTFNEFIESDRIIFPLHGEAGQGKTNQLCHWTETLSDNNDAVITFAGADFAEIDLESRLKTIFGLSQRRPINRFLDKINLLAKKSDKKIYLFFDAVNEAINYPGTTEDVGGPLMLYRDIYRLFGHKELDRFKLLFTCRNYTWYNELLPEKEKQDTLVFFKPLEEGGASVRGFTDREVRVAYEVYKDQFQISTAFEDLKKGAILRLKDPLMFKVACTAYLGEQLPEATSEFTSINLFSKMLDGVARSYAGKGQVRILEALSTYMLDKYLAGEAVDSIMVEDLKSSSDDINHPLHNVARLMYKNDGVTVDFAELLKLSQRPILRLADQKKVQFIYERFLEFLLSKAYLQKRGEVSAQTLYNDLKGAATNEVFMGAMRNVLIMNLLKSGDRQVFSELLSLHGDDIEVFTLISGTLNILVRELYTKEIFDLERHFLSWAGEGQKEIIGEFNDICKQIDSNKASDKTIERYKVLSGQLTSMVRMRNIATTTLISGLLLSDAHNEGIFEEDPYSLLWMLMDDPLTEVKNNACMQAYYVSRRKLTLNYEPLHENITQQIVRRIFEYIGERPLSSLLLRTSSRTRTVTLLEFGVRLDVILIIDLLLEGTVEDRGRVTVLIDEIRQLIRRLTLNFTVVRAFMPFFSFILRRQVTFQSAYVNNLTEYTTFWNDEVVAPGPTPDGKWNRTDVSDLAPMVFLFSHYNDKDAPLREKTPPSIAPYVSRIVAAYRTGDSLSYFLLERLLVIFGLSDWDTTSSILEEIDRILPETEWYDYSQMSFIYVLYQLGLKMDVVPQKVEEMLVRNCTEWTRRCRGYFRAHNSSKANPLQLYKRNVMSWYAMVWCSRNGDLPNSKDSSVPVFRDMLKEAITTRDKELLVHLINCIAELITDSGDIHTALALLRVIFKSIPSKTVLAEFDKNATKRYPDTDLDIITLIGNILGVAKNYYPAEVNDFLTRGIVGLRFPGIPKYKDDILSYNPSGEKLSDLLTHKFGNFIIWALIHEENVDEVVADCLKEASNSSDSAAWFDKCVRIVMRALLNIKI